MLHFTNGIWEGDLSFGIYRPTIAFGGIFESGRPFSSKPIGAALGALQMSLVSSMNLTSHSALPMDTLTSLSVIAESILSP